MRISIVITGYYFKYVELYQLLIEEANLYEHIDFEFYILSHKKQNEITDEIRNFLDIRNFKIIYFDNIGWDWGCHSQFVKWYIENGQNKIDFILFLHDDIKIKKNGFIGNFLEKINEGFILVGNSLPFTIINKYLITNPEEVYILERKGFQINSNKIRLVRGSAFFINYEAAVHTLQNLPYQTFGTIDFANRSLRMFASVFASKYGYEKVSYLSDLNFKSQYIIEEMRGTSHASTFLLKRRLTKLLALALFILQDTLIFFSILKRNRRNEINGLLKLNITNRNVRIGYLNYSIERKDLSDLEYNEILSLLKIGRIAVILIDEDVFFNEINFLNEFLFKIVSTTVKIDVLIEGAKIKCDYLFFDEFVQKFNNVKIYNDFYYKRKKSGVVNRRILLKINS